MTGMDRSSRSRVFASLPSDWVRRATLQDTVESPSDEHPPSIATGFTRVGAQRRAAGAARWRSQA